MNPFSRFRPGVRPYVILPFVISYMVGILIGADWRWYGGIVWTLISGFVMYHIGLWIASQFILPMESTGESRSYAHDVLLQFASGDATPLAIIRDGAVLPTQDGKPRKNKKSKGAVLVDSSSVVILKRDSAPGRMKGPGLHFIRSGEQISGVADLRQQFRTDNFRAQTRDGIWVKFAAFIIFQIDGVKLRNLHELDRVKEPWPEPYVWSQRQVGRALSRGSVGKSVGKEEVVVRWDTTILNEMVDGVRTLVAKYTFDRLTEPHNPYLNPGEDINEEIEKQIKAWCAGKGLSVIVMGVGQFSPLHKEIDQQRFETWWADWFRRTKVTEAIGNANVYSKIESARAQAQMDTVSRVMQALQESKDAGVDSADLIALRFLETLENLADDRAVRQHLSDNAQDILKQLRKTIGIESEDDDSDAST